MLKLLIYPVFYFIAIIPFPLIYLITYTSALLLHYIFPYRGKVIDQNLKQAFPDKNREELRKYRKIFYRNYCEIFFEGIKVLTIKEKTLLKRIEIVDNEDYKRYREEKRGVVNLTGHRGNFEYMGQIAGLLLPLPVIGVYRPFKNKAFEDFWREKIRHRFKTRFIPAKAVMKHILTNMRKGLYITFLNDQNPTLGDQHVWVSFMNKETPFFTAPAKIAIKYKMPVYFVDMRRTKLGYYRIQITNITEDASRMSEEDIIKQYVILLEKAIREDPPNWLWSHKRWKYIRKGDEVVKEGYE